MTPRAAIAFFALLLLLPGASFGQDTPQPRPHRTEQQQIPESWDSPYPPPDAGYVTDLANLLTPEEEERIEQRLWDVEEQTGLEIAVVTIDTIGNYSRTANGSIERFAQGLFDTYGIGNLPNNNGVLLLVSRFDRKARIELGAGYGRQRDSDAERIMQGTIIPRFKRSDYADGISRGVDELIVEFTGGASIEYKSADSPLARPAMTLAAFSGGGYSRPYRAAFSWTPIVGIALIPVLILVAISLFRNGKRGWGWVVVGMIFIILLGILRILATVAKNMPKDGGGGGRGGSSGWSSGGFGGGFGGGSSGGGGATGSW